MSARNPTQVTCMQEKRARVKCAPVKCVRVKSVWVRENASDSLK